jgi:chemotaxis family two-component system response regulator Rcp1
MCMSLSRSRRSIEILLVEDNPGDVRLTKEALKEGESDVHLSVVRDGIEALAFLLRHGQYANVPRPDLIFLDLNLPRKNGREVLTEIKHNPCLRRIPVIILTTSQADSDVLHSYDLHANCYITKPVDLARFMTIIRSVENFWFNTATLPSN